MNGEFALILILEALCKERICVTLEISDIVKIALDNTWKTRSQLPTLKHSCTFLIVCLVYEAAKNSLLLILN